MTDSSRNLGVREGARQIGEALGPPGRPVPARRVLYLAQIGLIRTFHMGRRLCATDQSLAEDLERLQTNGGGG